METRGRIAVSRSGGVQLTESMFHILAALGEPEDARGKKTYLIAEAGRKALAEEAGRLAAMARLGLAAARRGADRG